MPRRICTYLAARRSRRVAQPLARTALAATRREKRRERTRRTAGARSVQGGDPPKRAGSKEPRSGEPGAPRVAQIGVIIPRSRRSAHWHTRCTSPLAHARQAHDRPVGPRIRGRRRRRVLVAAPGRRCARRDVEGHAGPSALATYAVNGRTAAPIIHQTALKHGINPGGARRRVRMRVPAPPGVLGQVHGLRQSGRVRGGNALALDGSRGHVDGHRERLGAERREGDAGRRHRHAEERRNGCTLHVYAVGRRGRWRPRGRRRREPALRGVGSLRDRGRLRCVGAPDGDAAHERDRRGGDGRRGPGGRTRRAAADERRATRGPPMPRRRPTRRHRATARRTARSWARAARLPRRTGHRRSRARPDGAAPKSCPRPRKRSSPASRSRPAAARRPARPRAATVRSSRSPPR